MGQSARRLLGVDDDGECAPDHDRDAQLVSGGPALASGLVAMTPDTLVIDIRGSGLELAATLGTAIGIALSAATDHWPRAVKCAHPLINSGKTPNNAVGLVVGVRLCALQGCRVTIAP